MEKIIVDGSNIAFSKKSPRGKAKFANLNRMVSFLREIGQKYSFIWEIIIDATLRHKIDDSNSLEKMLNKGIITQCPKGVQADEFIIRYSRNHPDETIIISNDNFRDYNVENLKILKFLVVFDEIITYPNIKDILQKIKKKKDVKVNA